MITGRNTVMNVMFILAGILFGFLLFGMQLREMGSQKKIRFMLIYCLWFFLLMIFGWLNGHKADAILDYAVRVEGMSGAVSGCIYDVKVYDNYTDIYIKADSLQAVSGEEKITYRGSTNILLRIYDTQKYKLGQQIEACGTYALFQENSNPGGFNSKLYYENKNIYLYCDNGCVTALSHRYNVIIQYLRNLKEKLAAVFDTVYSGKHSGIMKTMLLGDKTDLETDVQRAYRINGIAHVLAISGLHIAMIGMWIFKRLRKLTGSYILSGVLAIILIILYGIMTGLGTATFRAVIMLILTIIASVLGRTSDLLTSMGVACVILCMINPFIIRDAGFLLSFGAVFAIGAVTPIFQSMKCGKVDDSSVESGRLQSGRQEKADGTSLQSGRLQSGRHKETDGSSGESTGFAYVRKLIKKCLDNLKDALIVSLSINLVITPIIIYFYYEFPLYGIIVNLFVIPLMSVVVMFGIITGIVGIVWSPDLIGMHFLSLPAELALDAYDVLCNFFGKLPCSSINTGHISIHLILIYYGTLAILLYGINWFQRNVPRKTEKGTVAMQSRMGFHPRRIPGLKRYFIVGAMLVSLAICVASGIYEFKPGFHLVFLDVGQGDGILITTEAGTNILIDGGSTSNNRVGEYVLSPAIKYYGMSDIDYVFLTHGDTDHISGIRYLIEEEYTGITIDNLVIAEYGDRDGLAEIVELAQEKGIHILYMDTGDRLLEYGSENIGALAEVSFILECIYPDEAAIAALKASGADLTANDLSLVLRMDYGELSVLFTGDIGSDVESYLVENNAAIDCDILKIPHHGSKYSSSLEFLTGCLPCYSVISCGLNNLYGHPHSDTISRLETIGTNIYRTDLSGAICVEVKDGGVVVEYYGEGR